MNNNGERFLIRTKTAHRNVRAHVDYVYVKVCAFESEYAETDGHFFCEILSSDSYHSGYASLHPNKSTFKVTPYWNLCQTVSKKMFSFIVGVLLLFVIVLLSFS